MSDVLHLRSFAKLSQAGPAEEVTIVQMNLRLAEEAATREQEMQRKYQTGFSEGYSAAKKELELGFEDMMLKKSEEFFSILESFEEKLAGYENVFNELVVKLAVQVSEKIIKSEIQNSSVIESSLQEAVKKVMGANQVFIKIHPKDYELINNSGQAQLIERNFDRVKFEVTDKIEEGGCVIETEIGNVDARIQSQINVIGRQLEQVFLSNV